MDNRYTNIQQKTDRYGRTSLRASLYPPIPKKTSDIYVMTVPGDRLDLLAHKYYNNVNYVWIIAEANGVGKGSYVLEPSLQIRIPTDINPIINSYRQLNGL